jgi:hypothetical protein
MEKQIRGCRGDTILDENSLNASLTNICTLRCKSTALKFNVEEFLVILTIFRLLLSFMSLN